MRIYRLRGSLGSHRLGGLLRRRLRSRCCASRGLFAPELTLPCWLIQIPLLVWAPGLSANFNDSVFGYPAKQTGRGTWL